MMNCVKILLLVLCATTGMAQDNVYVRATYGTYQMGDLQEFQGELAKDFQNNSMPVKITSTFPASLQVEAGMDFPTEFHTFGFFVNYAITQGRLHYGDYSGETFAEQNLNRFLLGFKAATDIAENLELYGKIGGGISTLNLDFETRITGVSSSEKEQIKFKALGLSVEPGIQWNIPYRKLAFSVAAGYEFNFNGKTKHKELGSDNHLVNKKNESITLDWTGVRLSAGIAFLLSRE